jgi:ribosomal protein S27AE
MPVKSAPRPAVALPSPPRLREATPLAEHFDYDRVACRECGSWFPAPEGSALLYSLKGPCPSCGGDFVLLLGEAD